MKSYQKAMIDLLKAAINEKKIVFSKENHIDWDEMVAEAEQHKISALIYSSMDKSSFKYMDNNILSKWKKYISEDSVSQIRHIYNISKLVYSLNEHRIEVILLKGLILRNYYPKPEFRTMCDADILVKPEDYLTVKKYLIKNGYKCYENNHPVHQCFMCSNQLVIEVHWKLINENYLNSNIKDFEEDIWKKSIEVNICGVNCKTLCNEDFLIHMCLHMAVHAKYSGIGVRQLYDVAVFVKNKNIEWTSFCSRISFYGISKFTKGLFELLHQIFDINIPEDILENEYISKQDLRLLLKNILSSGVHGKNEEKDGFGQLSKYSGNSKYVNNNIKILLKFIFPTRAELSYRYKYAKANVLLLPIAWIHHAIRGIFIRKYGFIKMIKYYKTTLNYIDRRKEIIKIFEL